MTDILKIFKHCHYSTELFPKFICWKKSFDRSETYEYTFTDSCRYDIGSDQTDKNKLFGWSYGMHHKNSVRVTWWYDKKADAMRFCLYIYENGKLYKYDLVGQYPLNCPLRITLESESRSSSLLWHSIRVEYDDPTTSKPISRSTVAPTDKSVLSKWGYTLNLYFGGNRRAPHTMTVIKKHTRS